jgi:hypothetical protein
MASSANNELDIGTVRHWIANQLSRPKVLLALWLDCWKLLSDDPSSYVGKLCLLEVGKCSVQKLRACVIASLS